MTPEQLLFVLAVIGDGQGDGPESSVLLKDILAPHDYIRCEQFLADGWAPERPCDECAALMSTEVDKRHMFSVGPEGITSYFICARCSKRWEVEASLPNILAKFASGEGL